MRKELIVIGILVLCLTSVSQESRNETLGQQQILKEVLGLLVA